MKLILTPTSPYARKVRILIRERGAESLVHECVLLPLEDPPELRCLNPLGKVPVLIPEDDEPIFDSPLIVEYLDQHLPGDPLLPAQQAARFASLRWQALADGIVDAALAATFERMRQDAAPSEFWMDRWRKAVLFGLEAAEAKAHALPSFPDVGAIAMVCALGYLDLRHHDLSWRQRSPHLATWFGRVESRASFIATAPPP